MIEMNIVTIITALLVAGMAAQWIAWRFHLPAIVLLSVTGVLLGPVAGFINPAASLGEFLDPLISLAVAVILFDGGLNLHLKELRETRRAVRQMVIIGAPLGWFMLAASAHYIAGLSWPVAILFGGVLVVTGPTVIMPLLRQAKLNLRVSSVLKWEGIVNDPIGALFAVLAYEYLVHEGFRQNISGGVLEIATALGMIAGMSYLLGRLSAYLLNNDHMPEFLKSPVILTTALVAYVAANTIQHEGGLIAVTVLGMTLANTTIPGLEDIKRFKEYITLMLVSLVFIVLTATLTTQDLIALDWRAAVFIAAVMFVVRPLKVFISSIGTGMSLKEKLFVGWIAPRGIVLVAICGLFGPLLVEAGYPDGAKLVPLAFGVVFATVLAHGFSVSWLGRKLGLTAEHPNGVLIVGANPWTQKLAEELMEQEIPVMVADNNWHRLSSLRLAEVPVFYGELIAEDTAYHLEFNSYTYYLACTNNLAYNALACANLAHDFGRERVFQLPGDENAAKDAKAYNTTMRGRTLVGDGAAYEELRLKDFQGWQFTTVKLTEEFTYNDFLARYGSHVMPLLTISPDEKLHFHTVHKEFRPESGDKLVAFVWQKDKLLKEKAGKPNLPDAENT